MKEYQASRPLRVASHTDQSEGRHIAGRDRLRMRILMIVTASSHMNEICPLLVNKNLFSLNSEIFTFNPETKTV